jgi:hypothetical protein
MAQWYLISVQPYWPGMYPDNSLPGQPPYPSQGPGFPTNPIAPGGPPPGVWPQPPVGIWPGQPGHRPDQGLPQPPGVWPGQPPRLWPQPPGQPGHPDQGVPPQPPPGMVVVWIPGRGWTYIQAGVHPDQGLPQPPPGAPPRPDQGLPGSQPHPDQGLPPTAQPKK